MAEECREWVECPLGWVGSIEIILTYKDLEDDLRKISQQMSLDGLDFGLIGYIGGSPEYIGNFFAEHFGCKLLHLPSINRKNRNKTLAGMVNKIYPFLPENILKLISSQYKRLYKSSERIFPEDFKFDKLSYEKDLPILLVDDNALTGKTFEIWKKKIKENIGKSVYTFSITVAGDYKPDYLCIEGWHSFEWRSIGI